MEKPDMRKDGIIDPERNPFSLNRWIEDGLPFTLKRQNQFKEKGLVGKLQDDILSNPDRNKSRYLAFVAIAWGFAELKDRQLHSTEKWKHHIFYDGYGKLINKVETISISTKYENTPRPSLPHSNKPTKLLGPFRRDELIHILSLFQVDPVIERYLAKDNLPEMTSEEILDFSVDSSIYRAFHYESPKNRYKKWHWYRNPIELCAHLDTIHSQQEFDRFLYDIGASMVSEWGKLNDRGGSSKMNIGIALKINNLIIKHLVFSKHTTNAKIKEWLHVPWDQYTLYPISKIWSELPVISGSPSQGFVTSFALYQKLHEFISEITQEAGVNRISYEFLTWDAAH